MDGDQERHPQGQISPEEVWRPVASPEAPNNQENEKSDDHSDADQAQFFPDHGKDEVRVHLRKVKKLLPAIPQPYSEYLSRPKSQKGLNDLKSGVARVTPGVLVDEQPFDPIMGPGGQIIKYRNRRQDCGAKEKESRAARKKQEEHERSQNDARPKIWLF